MEYAEEPPRFGEEDGGGVGRVPNDAQKNAEILRECTELLQSQDYIMEPSIYSTLTKYVSVGGNPDMVVDYLSSNYDAIAQTSNLLAEWLLMADISIAEVQTLVEETLKKMIIKYFDPKKADSIFSDETRGTPAWLTEMIIHPTWRNLIYKLAEDFPECLMLNFTVKLISDAGFQGEITSISTASQQLEVFTRILKTSIESFLATGEEKLSKETQFTVMVCKGEHTYLFSQALMHLLSLEPKGGASIKRLSQEICNYAQKNGHDATPISVSLMGASSNPRLAGAMTAMLAKNALNPADISILYRLYNESKETPPVDLLRIPQFLELLLEALFKPGSKLHADQRPKYIFLLSYAASVHEQYKKATSYTSYNNVAMRKSVNREELKATIAAVEKVSALCSERKGSSEILPELGNIFALIGRFQVAALGLVYWVKHVVSEASFFKLSTEQTPLHLALLDEVTACHQTLHSKVLDLYIGIFEATYEELEVLAQLELKKMILDRMVHLLSKGCVLPVMRYVKERWEKGDTDISLIRYFVTEVLFMISPPYSEDFVALFLPLVECEEVTGSMRTESDGRVLVTEFIETCKGTAKE